MSETATAIQPAMTAEEWRVQAASRGSVCHIGRNAHGGIYAENRRERSFDEIPTGLMANEPDQLHVLAALALHGQPFGFTQAEVARLRELVEWGCSKQEYGGLGWDDDEDGRLARGVVDKLAALLPTE